MNRAEKTGEPSMEEILASIRKIIAEEPASARRGPDERAVNPLLRGSEPRPERTEPAALSNDRPLPSLDRLSEALKSTAPVPLRRSDRPRPRAFDDDLADLLDEPEANRSAPPDLHQAAASPADRHQGSARPPGESWSSWPVPTANERSPADKGPKESLVARAEPAPGASPSGPASSGNGAVRRGGFYPPSGFAPGSAIASEPPAPSPARPQMRVEPVPQAAEPRSVDTSAIVPARSDASAGTAVDAFSRPAAEGPELAASGEAFSSGPPIGEPMPDEPAEPALEPAAPAALDPATLAARASEAGARAVDVLAAGFAGSPGRANAAAGPAPETAPHLSHGASAAAPARSLEDAVADMLKPMLQQWLTDNMPRIIEKALRVEATAGVKSHLKPPGT